ncbi:T-complex protein 1 subunit alpha [Sesamum angolense]|uniref:T-complex protein 1 subunit alpha n=1 Tax=Sesamum angolense TaxID=2727404 RepID=A0AAE2BTP8_9LAMI|nr:T-complex protein 1 subunit alpha [Sesamum angolense]
MAINVQAPDISGERQSGQDVRTQNVVACQAVANIVKSSLGPVGLDKVLVELAELQDREVGDGTTSVVIIAAELLKVVEAVQAVKMTNARGEVKYPIKSKKDGNTSCGFNEHCVWIWLAENAKENIDSFLLKGYALNTGRAAQGMPLRVAPARIACLDFNLQKTKMQMGVQVLVTDPRELERIRQRMSVRRLTCNLVMADYFVEAGAIAVRRVRKEDLRHVAKATGVRRRSMVSLLDRRVKSCNLGCPDLAYNFDSNVSDWIKVSTFADMEGEETFDSSFLGYADEVVEERIADDDVIMIKGTKTTSAVSLILRGAMTSCLMRWIGLCMMLYALSKGLWNLIMEQLAIAEFAEALLIIPKWTILNVSILVLAVNAAKDATELVAKLRAYHHTAQTKADKKHLSSMGLDLMKGTVRNNLEAGVIEPAMSKVKIIQFATEAAITILRIDDMIKLVKDESQNDED